MNFDLSEEQSLLRDLIDRFVADRYDPMRRLSYVAQTEGFPRDGWQLLAETGLLALPFAEEQGGFGGGAVELITVAESLGKGVATEPFLPVVLMAASLMERGGSAEQREAWLPAVIAGESLPAFAHFERASRFTPDNLETRESGGRLNGAKQAVLGAPFADKLVVTAAREDGTMGVFVVEADAAGITRTDYRMIDGSVASDVEFKDVAAVLLPEGAKALDLVLDQARLAIAAELVGLMSYMFAETVEFVKTRQQFGQAIGSFQAIQHRLADAYARVELSRSQLYRAAAQPPASAQAHEAIIGAKAFISENAQRIAEEAVQLHGGIGITEELMVGQAFKRTRLLVSLFGDSEWELRSYVDLKAA